MTEPTTNGPAGAPGPAPQSSGRGLRIALGLSLAANLLILGLIAGVVLAASGSLGRDRGDPPLLRSMGLGPLIVLLEPADRQALRARLEEAAPRLRPDAAGMTRAVRAFTDAIRGDPFDRPAVEAALAAQRAHVRGLQETGHGIVVDYLEQMPVAARDALADRLERRLRRGERGIDRRPDDRPGRDGGAAGQADY